MGFRQPPNLCIVLILRLKNRQYYPVYYRPAPVAGHDRDLWRFVPGTMRSKGTGSFKRAQAEALLLAQDLRTVRHPILGDLDVAAENVLLDTIVDVPWMMAVLVLPPFGRGRISLREVLERGARKVEEHDKRLIIGAETIH